MQHTSTWLANEKALKLGSTCPLSVEEIDGWLYHVDPENRNLTAYTEEEMNWLDELDNGEEEED